jgi:hypothetical protein
LAKKSCKCNMNSLEAILVNTYNPNQEQRLQAEHALADFLSRPGSCIQFLQLISNHSFHRDLRLAAVLVLKNRIEDFWSNADGLTIVVEEKIVFKQAIVDILLAETENSIRALLSDTIALIAQTDFPEEWPVLVPALVTNIQTHVTNPIVIHNALMALRKVMKRYQHKRDELRGPMNDIVEVLFPVIQGTVLPAYGQSNLLEGALVLKLCLKIFYSCCFSALPISASVNAQLWFELICGSMEKQLPEPNEVGAEPAGQPASIEDRSKWPWWKVVISLFCMFTKISVLIHGCLFS